MLRLVADENFNGRILRALLRRLLNLDVVRFQDTSRAGAVDPDLLAWAAAEERVILSHDVATLVGHAYQRVRSGRAMRGLIAVRTDRPIGRVLEDLELLIEGSEPENLDGRVFFVPL